MTYVPKRLSVYSAEIKEETTFGSENAPAAASDAFYLQFDSKEVPEMVTEAFEFDGDLGPNAVGFGPNRRVPKSGHSGKVTLSSYYRGPDAAYAAAVYAKNRVHLGFKIAGYVPTLDDTASSEKYTYVQAGPEVTPVSATGYFWGKQLLGESKMERIKLLAMLANLKIDAPNARPARFNFECAGIWNAIGDETFTAPTLAATPLPPLGTDLAVSYGTFTTGDAYSWNFDLGREITTERVVQSAAGAHLGFVAGDYNPMVNIVFQQTKFSDWNAYDIRNLASTAALAIENGSTQYNRFTLNGPQAQIIDVKPTNRGRIPQWTVSFLLPPSTPAANDSHNFVTD